MSKIKALLNKKYAHAVMVIYFLIYMPWFSWLNVFTPQRANVTDMYMKLDDMIPFCELFVIPYFIWFAYIAVGYVFLFFNKNACSFSHTCSISEKIVSQQSEMRFLCVASAAHFLVYGRKIEKQKMFPLH
jgi:hypothetical protein